MEHGVVEPVDGLPEARERVEVSDEQATEVIPHDLQRGW